MDELDRYFSVAAAAGVSSFSAYDMLISRAQEFIKKAFLIENKKVPNGLEHFNNIWENFYGHY